MNPGRRTHTVGTAAWEYLGWRLRMDEEPEAQHVLGLNRDEVAGACEAAAVLRRLRRVHTTFNQTVAATGRVITTDPNLQNIPIRTEEGRKIRRAIVAAPGRVLLGADYSQIDLRVLAHITNDPGLLDAFARDDDIHAVTAGEVFGVPRAEVTPELRRRAKTIVFGVAYGMSEFGLAAQLGISKAEAKAYIERYYERYPSVRQYMLDIVQQARQTGYV